MYYMPEIDIEKTSLIMATLYLAAVGGIGIFSIITLVILRKHAEKIAVATGVSALYLILFGIVLFLSLGNVIALINA